MSLLEHWAREDTALMNILASWSYLLQSVSAASAIPMVSEKALFRLGEFALIVAFGNAEALGATSGSSSGWATICQLICSSSWILQRLLGRGFAKGIRAEELVGGRKAPET